MLKVKPTLCFNRHHVGLLIIGLALSAIFDCDISTVFGTSHSTTQQTFTGIAIISGTTQNFLDKKYSITFRFVSPDTIANNCSHIVNEGCLILFNLSGKAWPSSGDTLNASITVTKNCSAGSKDCTEYISSSSIPVIDAACNQ